MTTRVPVCALSRTIAPPRTTAALLVPGTGKSMRWASKSAAAAVHGASEGSGTRPDSPRATSWHAVAEAP
ncbi:hypothetical protein ACGFYF_38770 [Streptomyces lavendulae]|uniref:hypothetical protein n=1 Tax=Streptomyces lavendulae TaxID=1914 RepID=UPI00371CBFAE